MGSTAYEVPEVQLATHFYAADGALISSCYPPEVADPQQALDALVGKGITGYATKKAAKEAAERLGLNPGQFKYVRLIPRTDSLIDRWDNLPQT